MNNVSRDPKTLKLVRKAILEEMATAKRRHNEKRAKRLLAAAQHLNNKLEEITTS